MKYTKIDNKLYSNNRERFIKKMRPNAIAVFHANSVLPENGDAIYSLKQNSDVIWLSGVIQEKTMVILYPDSLDKTYREVLVILRPNDMLEKWEGHKLSKEEATEISGIKTVIFLDQLDACYRHGFIMQNMCISIRTKMIGWIPLFHVWI